MKEKRNLSDMSKSLPRGFWKYIKKNKRNTKSINNDVNINEFVQHFANRSKTLHIEFNADEFSHVREERLHIEKLGVSITIDEISNTISYLKRN